MNLVDKYSQKQSDNTSSRSKKKINEKVLSEARVKAAVDALINMTSIIYRSE
ncbi:hypothetical protein [Anaeroselena agilis]|uniref:Uncharacterized protein n=1 Tax=Anaeroselena agilis TaxID=3063788 RepID=A0ABU3NWC7_9FIRM|nr:hypothetical protein [Selenomonadales bacterium 4137-cl]